MITNIKNIKTFTADELSNEDYHAHEFISGTGLVKIYFGCPAEFRFAEQKESPALHFGIASHAALLEPEKFEAEFVRDLCKDDYPDALTSEAATKSWLKERGVKGYSTKTFDQLMEMVEMTGESPQVWKDMTLKFQAENLDKTIVPAKDFDKIMQMRAQVFADPDNVGLLKGAQVETSIICEVEINGTWHGVKIRPDIITKNFEVPDYKTCQDMTPEKFGRDAHDRGYWLKQAFIHDVLQAAYNQDPKMGLLAQGKLSPFIPQLYWMTDHQIDIGREQYQFALEYYSRCLADNCWPAYFDGPADLPTPEYLARTYGIEE